MLDNELSARLRSAGKEILKAVGKKILSGKFNLTTISFPIKCMCSHSILECVALIARINSYYLNAAAVCTDPLERMKLVMTSTIAFFHPTHQFEKPLNPILGETYEAMCPDGTHIYAEQTCHRPPCSNICIEGPNKIYTLNCWNSFNVKAWLNSCTLYVEGRKTLHLLDGSVIEWNNQGD